MLGGSDTKSLVRKTPSKIEFNFFLNKFVFLNLLPTMFNIIFGVLELLDLLLSNIY